MQLQLCQTHAAGHLEPPGGSLCPAGKGGGWYKLRAHLVAEEGVRSVHNACEAVLVRQLQRCDQAFGAGLVYSCRRLELVMGIEQHEQAFSGFSRGLNGEADWDGALSILAWGAAGQAASPDGAA